MDRLQAMTAFVRVVETGSFSQAARQIGVGQPAISKTIAQLEDRLQVRLLIRSTHGLSPTDAAFVSSSGRRPQSRRRTRPNWRQRAPALACLAACVSARQRRLLG